WWTTKLLDVLVQAGHQLARIVRIALKHPRLGNDAALGLSQPEHAAELGRLAGLALANDRGMRFEQADQLLPRWNRLPLDDAAPGLADHLLDPWHDCLEDLLEALRCPIGLL